MSVIDEQLEQLVAAREYTIDEKTGAYIFKKLGERTVVQPLPPPKPANTKMIIEIEDYFLNPTFSFHESINAGKGPPPAKRLEVIEVRETEKSVYFTSDSWEGWIPKKCFKEVMN